MSNGICEGRVAVVTGAGRGIGRGHALELARQGARVVVNDLGAARDGADSSDGPATTVASEIIAMGGEAVANTDDISTMDGASALIDQAIETFGGLDVVVNNAGILRDRMIINMTEQEWDDIMRVHLKGTFAPTHFAGRYWRNRAKEGLDNDARVINTSSSSGIYGNTGQANYGAAKAGIASFTIIAARELGRYGVTVNALAPAARTRMTADRPMGEIEIPPGEFDPFDPDHLGPLVAWLASDRSKDITARVFNAVGGRIGVSEGWRSGPVVEKQERWTVEELDEVLPQLVADALPVADISGSTERP